LHHYVTFVHINKEPWLVSQIMCEDVGGGDLLPFLMTLDITKLISLMPDPEKPKKYLKGIKYSHAMLLMLSALQIEKKV